MHTRAEYRNALSNRPQEYCFSVGDKKAAPGTSPKSRRESKARGTAAPRCRVGVAFFTLPAKNESGPFASCSVGRRAKTRIERWAIADRAKGRGSAEFTKNLS